MEYASSAMVVHFEDDAAVFTVLFTSMVVLRKYEATRM